MIRESLIGLEIRTGGEALEDVGCGAAAAGFGVESAQNQPIMN